MQFHVLHDLGVSKFWISTCGFFLFIKKKFISTISKELFRKSEFIFLLESKLCPIDSQPQCSPIMALDGAVSGCEYLGDLG